MDEEGFLMLFEKHARKIREVKSYREMIRNIRSPGGLSGDPCPFGGTQSEMYFVISRNGRVAKYDDGGRVATHYEDCAEYWKNNNYSNSLKNEMISILRKLQKEERGK